MTSMKWWVFGAPPPLTPRSALGWAEGRGGGAGARGMLQVCPCPGLGPGAQGAARPVVDVLDQRVVGWDWEWVGGAPPATAQPPVVCPGAEQGPSPDPPGPCLFGRKDDGRSAYRTVQEQGFATDARQKGIWRSIGDESLAPLAHLQEAMALPLGEDDRTSGMSSFTAQAIEATAAL